MSLFDREKQIETYFIRRVKMAGALNRKIQYVMINGCPDRLVIFPGGKVCFVELKKPKNTTAAGALSRIQQAEHERMAAVGVKVVVLSTRDDVDRFIKANT
jgi:hypothetical protein